MKRKKRVSVIFHISPNPSALTWQIRRHLLKHCHRSMNHLEFLAPAGTKGQFLPVPPVHLVSPCRVQVMNQQPPAAAESWFLWCRLGEAKVYPSAKERDKLATTWCFFSMLIFPTALVVDDPNLVPAANWQEPKHTNQHKSIIDEHIRP